MNPLEASKQYNWIKVDESSRSIEMYMDHHMLSTLRTCEAKYLEEHLINLRPFGYKSWSLTFGAFLHKCLETFYNSMKDDPHGKPIEINEFLKYCKVEWEYYKLEEYKDLDKKYKTLGGWIGAAALLSQYHAYYQDLRVRVVDTEVCFGWEKEVLIGQFIFFDEASPKKENYWHVRCYLTGRIDLIVDNGYKIGPVDHKHTMSYRGDESGKFNPHDGITGYIFALRSILKDRFPQYFGKTRDCKAGWIYHISSTQPKSGDRFKATPIYKSDSQLEEYRTRNLSTFKRVAELIFNNADPQWNTNACDMYGRYCEYKKLHEIIPEERKYIANQFYWIAPAWDARKVDEDQLLERDKVQEAKSLLEE